VRELCATALLYSSLSNVMARTWRGTRYEERMKRKGVDEWARRKKKDSRSLGQSPSYSLIMNPSPRMHMLMHPSQSEEQRFLTPGMLFFCG
jgi:hypothetical protein